jgi:hypothetical protein
MGPGPEERVLAMGDVSFFEHQSWRYEAFRILVCLDKCLPDVIRVYADEHSQVTKEARNSSREIV